MYATFLVSNNRDKMSIFLTRIAEDIEEECREAMLHENMYLSRLIVHVHQVEEGRRMNHNRAGEI